MVIRDFEKNKISDWQNATHKCVEN